MNKFQIKERLQHVFPPVPAGYDDSINAVLQSLDAQPLRQTNKNRSKFAPGKMVAAVLALIIAGSGCAFAVRPALAANIPVVNELVYALSPTVEPSEEIQNKIIEAVQDILSAFISNATSQIGVRFKSGGNWALNQDTLLAAYYLHFTAASAQLINDDKIPALANIAVKSIKTEQKGFRYTALLTYDILLDEKYYITETVTARLEEGINGLYITSLDINSEGFEAYKENIALYDRAEYDGGALDENIANYNAFLIGRQLALDELEQHQTTVQGTEMTQHELKRVADIRALIEQVRETDSMNESERKKRIKQLEAELAQYLELRTPRNRQLEALAAELCYRYWSADDVPDMSDIMERNNDTELWFLDLKLHLANKFRTPSVIAEKGYAEILEIMEEADGLITVKVYVKTIIQGSIGQTVQISFKPSGDKYIIAAYSSPWDDGLHRELKRLADQYVKEGMSHSDANAKAYETLYIMMMERINELEDMMEK